MKNDIIAQENYSIEENANGAKVLYDGNKNPICSLGSINPDNELLGFFLLNDYQYDI